MTDDWLCTRSIQPISNKFYARTEPRTYMKTTEKKTIDMAGRIEFDLALSYVVHASPTFADTFICMMNGPGTS